MSEVTIKRKEIEDAFSMVREPMRHVGDSIDMDSYGRNMGYDNDSLVEICLDYIRDNSDSLPPFVVCDPEETATLVATIAAFMTRFFHVGLVLGRQHPIK